MTALITRLIAILFFITNIAYAAEKKHSTKLCDQPNYSCYTVKRGDSWKKLYPDDEQRDLVMRINRMNTPIYKGQTIAVPISMDGNINDYSPLPSQINPPGRKTIIVSIQKLAFGAYDSNGELKHWGPISSARGYCPDIHRSCNTARGQFAIYDKKGADCKSTRFPIGRGGAPMPYCMFFNGNFALHGSYEVPGYNASHGCVRMFVDDAKWLNQDFTAGEKGVRVIVQ